MPCVQVVVQSSDYDAAFLESRVHAWAINNATALLSTCDEAGVEGGLLVPGWREALKAQVAEPAASAAAAFADLRGIFEQSIAGPNWAHKRLTLAAADAIDCEHLRTAFAATLGAPPDERALVALRVDPAARGGAREIGAEDLAWAAALPFAR